MNRKSSCRFNDAGGIDEGFVDILGIGYRQGSPPAEYCWWFRLSGAWHRYEAEPQPETMLVRPELPRLPVLPELV